MKTALLSPKEKLRRFHRNIFIFIIVAGIFNIFFPLVAHADIFNNDVQDVYATIEDRRLHPKEGSYTNYLFEKGIDKILKKCGEEAAEIIIAAKNPNPEEVKYEMADFLYHMMVLMAERGITWDDIAQELANRE